MREIHRFASLPSTMNKAIELAEAGCPSGTVVVAEEQTAGQGRFGRAWHSERGAGPLYVRGSSAEDLPGQPAARHLGAGPRNGRGAHAMLPVSRPTSDGRTTFCLNSSKCAGILVQLHDGVLIAGIGINVNHTSFPAELADRATSLRLATGREHDRENSSQRLSTPSTNIWTICCRNGRESVLRAFSQASSYVRGRRVVVDQNGSEITGVTDGLDPQGFLLLRQDNGQTDPDPRRRSEARMILALDVGNTNITIGLFENGALTRHWRLRTVHDQTADEWGILLRNLFSLGDLHFDNVDGIIIASVVPPLDSTLGRDVASSTSIASPMFVTHETDTGLRILYDNPREVGADRIVNGVAAFHRYGGPCIVVDLGTAITFDAVSANAEYLGGVICPGIGMSVQGLFSRTARLPLVDFQRTGLRHRSQHGCQHAIGTVLRSYRDDRRNR